MDYMLKGNLLLTPPLILLVTVECFIMHQIGIMPLQYRRKFNAPRLLVLFYPVCPCPVEIHLISGEGNWKISRLEKSMLIKL
jgi:hypothetical protein